MLFHEEKWKKIRGGNQILQEEAQRVKETHLVGYLEQVHAIYKRKWVVEILDVFLRRNGM